MRTLAGIWNRDGTPVAPELVKSLKVKPTVGAKSSLLPDESLMIIDERASSTSEWLIELRPYRSAGGALLSWDGRLDNRDELISELAFPKLSTAADAVIVGAAFDHWAEACFAKLVGDWAVSIWEPNQHHVFLARDYIGIKPLFYSLSSIALVWCNDLARLVEALGHLTLCEEYIAGFLASFPNAALTPYREILSVPPGAFVCCSASKMLIQNYWSWDPQVRTTYKNDRDYEEHYRYLFQQAVRRRLRTNFPVLAELSGGFDSSSIVCMADSVLARGETRAPRLDTISFYDPNEPEDDDFAYFTAVEEQRGRAGFHVRLDLSRDCLPFTFPRFVDRPGLGVSRELDAALKRILEDHNYGVMLSGNGGDEFNGQALDPRLLMTEALLDGRLLSFIKQLTEWSLLIRKRPWLHLFFQTLLYLMPASVQARFFEHGKLEPWINLTFAKKHRMAFCQIHAFNSSKRWMRPRAQYAADSVAAHARQMTAAAPWRVERWYPFLDQDLVVFLTTIPLEQLLRPGERRCLMRRALADLLPKPVLQRTTKAGLGRCFSIALENHWDAVEEISEAPLVSQLGYIQAEQLRRSLASLRKGEHPTFVLRLLKVLALELWLRDVSARGLLSLPGTGLRMGEWPDSDRVCDPATLLIATAGRKVVGIS